MRRARARRAAACAPSARPASALPPCNSVAAPSRWLSQSPNTRPAVIPPEKAANASAATAVLVPRSRAQVDAAPVRHRALGDHDDQAQHRQHDDAARGADEAGRRLGRRRALAEPAQAGGEQQREQAGRDQRLDARVDPGAAGDRHERRAREPAEAPAGVQRGHDRPLQDRARPRRRGRSSRRPSRRSRRRGRPGRAAAATAAGASSGSGSTSAQSMPAIRVARTLPSRTIAWPMIGSATITPIAIVRMTSPSVLLEKSKRSWIHGMCATQVPITAPLTKKTPKVAPARRHARTTRDAGGARSRSVRSSPASVTRWVTLGERRHEPRARRAQLVGGGERDHLGRGLHHRALDVRLVVVGRR